MKNFYKLTAEHTENAEKKLKLKNSALSANSALKENKHGTQYAIPPSSEAKGQCPLAADFGPADTPSKK
ncbi:MAG: hypothetical protein ACYSW7_10745 [Planctomycetota bacterium]